jgi:pyruvoyl-dependent arginine decarboxylase (PvlArgDC)
MKKLEKIELISQIGRELQTRMTYSDISSFLSEFNININKPTSNVNSKWVYVKDLLSGEPDNLILQIADEIGIEHNLNASDINIQNSDFWLPFHFKLFISHLAKYKEKAQSLKIALLKYGISSFVAHDDIVPTKEWQIEIEKALFSMDALTAILTPEFENSKWTDQEIGIAIGQQILIIPIRKGLDPYGFIGKYQGFNSNNKTVEEVAIGIAEILFTNNKTNIKMVKSISDLIINSTKPDDILKYFNIITDFSFITKDVLEQIQDKYKNSNTIMGNKIILTKVESLLKQYKMLLDNSSESDTLTITQYDIPF